MPVFSVARAKQSLIELFLHPNASISGPFDYRVTSLYWQAMDMASDAKKYQHLAGTPYVYEQLLDARFRISPSTFFQTNTRSAEVLYVEIANALGLTRQERAKPMLIMDICCGAGTIGIACMKLVEKQKSQSLCGCVGVEIVPEAIEDAKRNVRENGLREGR